MIKMLELYIFYFVWTPVIFFTVYFIWSRLQKQPEYKCISSFVPSMTKSFWNEIMFSWDLARKPPIEMFQFFMDLLKINGPVIHFNLAGRPYVLINDPDDIKILLSNSQYNHKGPEYDMMKPWLNEGLLLSSGSKWKARRKLLTNTFHFKTLQMYLEPINKHSQILADKLLKVSANNREVSIAEYVTLGSLDMICETIMGTKMNAQSGKSDEYVHTIKRACKNLYERMFKFWLWNDLIFKLSGCGRSFYEAINILHDFTDKVIKNKRMEKENADCQKDQPKSQMKNVSFLDLLLNILEEFPELMTDKDIREEVDTFLFEGHDTSSLSMTMTLILLGIHQNIQDTAREELQSIFGDSDRDATIEDLNSMEYLDAIIKESLRLYPSVPVITREIQTSLQLKNYKIPPKTVLLMYTYIVHRNEDIYPDPEEFIPERFLDEGNKSKFLFGYLPFSAGPRNCIGQKFVMNQMKTVISTILRKAKIDTIGKKEDIQVYPSLITRIETVPKVKFYAI